MAGFSDYLENKVLNWLAGSAMGSPPTIYVGLFSSAPSDSGGGAEVTATIRAAGRVAASFGAASGGVILNNAIVDFGIADGSTNVTHFGLFDAASAGNFLGYGPVGTPMSFSAGVMVDFPVGSLAASLD